jgi:putative membrane protein
MMSGQVREITVRKSGSRPDADRGPRPVSARQPAAIVPDLWKGALAGFIGGLAGSAAKLLAEKIYPPRTRGQKAPPVVLAEKVAGHRLNSTEKTAAMQGMHWSFGPIVGAIYGAVVEYEPEVAARHGVAFGLGLNALTHEGALPLLGLTEKVQKQPRQEKWSEVASHAVYGFVTESVRRLIRGR